MIVLNQRQQEIFNNLIQKCDKIQNDLKTTVTENEPSEIQRQIETLRPHLSDIPTMLSDATAIFDFAKGQCAEGMLLDKKILNAKSSIQKMWIEGEMNIYNELFIRVESVGKKLDKSIETLVSLLSFEKEKIKYNIHQK